MSFQNGLYFLRFTSFYASRFTNDASRVLRYVFPERNNVGRDSKFGESFIIRVFLFYNIKKHHSFCVSDTRTTKPHQKRTLLLLGCTIDAKNHLCGYTKLIRNIYSNRGTKSPTNACYKRWSCRSFNYPIRAFPVARL